MKTTHWWSDLFGVHFWPNKLKKNEAGLMKQAKKFKSRKIQKMMLVCVMLRVIVWMTNDGVCGDVSDEIIEVK